MALGVRDPQAVGAKVGTRDARSTEGQIPGAAFAQATPHASHAPLMAVYCTREQVEDYLADSSPDNDLTLPSGDAGDRLIEHAERDVDRRLGRIPRLGSGLKLDPAILSLAQRNALSRAVGAAVEWRLLHDSEELAGASDLLPAGVSLIRDAGRIAPRVDEELAGFGLLGDRFTVTPTEDADPAA